MITNTFHGSSSWYSFLGGNHGLQVRRTILDGIARSTLSANDGSSPSFFASSCLRSGICSWFYFHGLPSSCTWTLTFSEYISAPDPDGGRGEMAMAILPRPGFSLAGGTSDAAFFLSCSVHEEGSCGHDVPAPSWEVRQAPLSPCKIRRV